MGYLKRLFGKKRNKKEEAQVAQPAMERPAATNKGESESQQQQGGEAEHEGQQLHFDQLAQQETSIQVIQREKPVPQEQQGKEEEIFTVESQPIEVEAPEEAQVGQMQTAVKQEPEEPDKGSGTWKSKTGRKRYGRTKKGQRKERKKKRAKAAGKNEKAKRKRLKAKTDHTSGVRVKKRAAVRKMKRGKMAKHTRPKARKHALGKKRFRALKVTLKVNKTEAASPDSPREPAGADLQSAAQPVSGSLQIREAAPKPLPGEGAGTGTGAEHDRFSEFVEGKAGGGVDANKLAELDAKVNELMKKYDISEMEVEKRLDGVNAQDIFSSIDRLISIIELEKKANETVSRVEKIQTAVPVSESVKRAEEIIGIATEIKKHQLVTAFDGIYSMINEKGHVKFGELASAFKMSSAKLEECCNVLREAGLIEIVYPAIGEPAAQAIDYNERVALEKLRKAAGKQGMQGKKGG